MGNIIEKTKYQEAYKCENGHFIPKYRQHGNFPVIDSMAFHDCCPECGSKEVSEVTGIWEREYVKINNLFGKRKKLIKKRFVESIFSPYNHESKKENEKLTEIDIYFKFAVGQAAKTVFGNEGVV